MTITWNVDKIISDLQRCYMAANDPYMTGWTNWPCKQDLYRVKFAIDSMLEKTATFAGEQEWLEEQEKQRVWNKLSETTNR